MRTILVAALATIASFTAVAQNTMKTYEISKDTENGSQVFKGPISFDILSKEASFTWYGKGIDAYQPNANDQAEVKKNIGKYRMMVFMGTWCDDSQDLVPKLYRLLTNVQYATADVKVYGVDRAKTTGDGAEKTYNVTRVPTIILFSGGTEIGRITENVQKSIESDLADIMLKRPSKN